MEDREIIGLYWARNEDAIRETSSKYGKLCFRIANNILANHEDSEECVNDTYLGLWNAIPEQRPTRFSVFISRIARNLSLKKFEYLSAAKRNPEAIYSFEELGDCVSGKESIENELENKLIEQTIDKFLWRQGEEKRNIFIYRYWYFESIGSICERTGFSQSKVKSILFDLRRNLRKYLESEGIEI